MVLPANTIAEALELSMNELVFDGRAPRSSSSFIFLSAFLTFLALLTTFNTVDSGRQARLRWSPARSVYAGGLFL